jgi:L-lactate dehydrogenase complex protein LldE
MKPPAQQSARSARASLFVTCVVDQFYPEVGESTVRLLRRLGVELDFPEGQTCCGQPAFNSGFRSDAMPAARRFLDTFKDSPAIVVPSGSCTAMIRVYYRELFQDDLDTARLAIDVGARTFELSEFIVDQLGVTDLAAALPGRTQGKAQKVAYHPGCHLTRELGVSTQPLALADSLPELELVPLEQADVCCGFGGTFSVKYPEISGAMLGDKVLAIRDSGADTVVACDATCLMQIGGGLERQSVPVRTAHLAQLLDEATS